MTVTANKKNTGTIGREIGARETALFISVLKIRNTDVCHVT